MGIISISLFLGIEANIEECYLSYIKRCSCGVQEANQLQYRFCGKCGSKFTIVDGDLTSEAKEYIRLRPLEDKEYKFVDGYFCKVLKEFDYYLCKNKINEIPLNKAVKDIREAVKLLNLKNKDSSPKLLYIAND